MPQAPGDGHSLPVRPIPRPRRSGTPEWLLRAMVESALVVASIVLALAVDEWRDDNDKQALAFQTLEIFEREIRQNVSRLADVLPYHEGMRDVVAGIATQPDRVIELRTIIEGLEPAVLLNTAWETALATGALTHIDIETVSALSLTYSLQQRFREETRAGLPRLFLTAANSDEQRREQIQLAQAYLTDIVRAEQELQVVFLQAIKQIDVALGRRETVDDVVSDSTPP